MIFSFPFINENDTTEREQSYETVKTSDLPVSGKLPDGADRICGACRSNTENFFFNDFVRCGL